jgi:hypothetical protein
MRSIISPVGNSYTAERTDDVVDTLEAEIQTRVDRWLGWVDAAQSSSALAVPDGERPALVARDHFLREHIYTLDPMNTLAAKFMDQEMVDTLIRARFGADQMGR